MFSIRFANTFALKKNKLEEEWTIWEVELLDMKINVQGHRTAEWIMQKTKPVSWS